MGKSKWVTLGLLLLSGAQLACKDACMDEKEAMQAFLTDTSHLTCAGNEDCVVVSTGCVPVSRGLCGQAALNKTAAASGAWKQLQADARDCDDGECAQCAAALLPNCNEGFCGGKP